MQYSDHHQTILPSRAFELDLLTALRHEIDQLQIFLRRIQRLTVLELVHLGMSRQTAMTFLTRVYGTSLSRVFTKERAFLTHYVVEGERKMSAEMSFARLGSSRSLSTDELIDTKNRCMDIWLLSRKLSSVRYPLPIGVWIEMFNISVVLINQIQLERM